MKNRSDILLEKLQAAKDKDRQFTAFGASTHRYALAPPLTEEEVAQFEQIYQVTLPAEYKYFITHVGNGGEYGRLGPGPAHGIYPLGQDNLSFMSGETLRSIKYLKQPCRFAPGISDDIWDEIIEDLEANFGESELEGRLYQGLLPIGELGCYGYSMLVVTGVHAGRIVYIGVQDSTPVFAKQAGFLDWYEDWLDGLVSERDLLWSARQRSQKEVTAGSEGTGFFDELKAWLRNIFAGQ